MERSLNKHRGGNDDSSHELSLFHDLFYGLGEFAGFPGRGLVPHNKVQLSQQGEKTGIRML